MNVWDQGWLLCSRVFHAYIRNGGVCWFRALVTFLDACGMWVFVYNGIQHRQRNSFITWYKLVKVRFST